jgi:TRAP-type C4-dicarboxylate transport system permease small subunit
MPEISRQPDALDRVGDALVTLGLRVAQVAVAAMVILITSDVISRNVFKVSLLISDEVSGYLLVCMTFFGIAYSLRTGSLLRIEFILFAMPQPLRKIADVLFDILALALSCILLHVFIRLVLSTWDRHMVAPTLIETPLWIPQLAMPIGGAILVVGFLLELRGSVKRMLGLAPPARTSSEVDLEVLG